MRAGLDDLWTDGAFQLSEVKAHSSSPQFSHYTDWATLAVSHQISIRISGDEHTSKDFILTHFSCLISPTAAVYTNTLKPSGHYMYRTVVTICTASLTFNNSTFCPHRVFMCFVYISEKTAIISLYSINWLVCITETECVYCAVRTGCFYIYI
jgi:hypothetical protein